MTLCSCLDLLNLAPNRLVRLGVGKDGVDLAANLTKQTGIPVQLPVDTDEVCLYLLSSQQS